MNPTNTYHTLSPKLARWTGKTVLWVFLLTAAILAIFPIVIVVLGSFKTNQELTSSATIWPQSWHFSNYVQAWKNANFSRFTLNSIFVSVATTIGTLLVASMSAYAVNRVHFFGKKAYSLLMASTLFISIGAVVLRPQFDLMVMLGLNKTLWGIIIILVSAHATCYFMLIGFFRSIPKDLDEAAMIDGCNFYSVYWRIVLPLLRPALAVAGLSAFQGSWNEYILPLVFTMSNPELQTLPVGLANLRYGIGAAAEIQLMMAGACLSILPLLVVYVFANKSFMQVTLGAVKG
ncbi:binding-protein-dependent transporters inner membrane component [Paenibacillus terrae HPL-003]|uniref:Binding-protein-dependent transporters inner membrane component n=1 Tax=Paenibacillus terrae (strain HPL-003) TaxID=985665 RepID=G7VRU4_PAETH|nr:carbohydrate ABC transporter permease [Paenibacillus terrae]AET62113.1 binding-protein-dependent transporters inner membrane component [Paenibacillus terrae HPL-003]